MFHIRHIRSFTKSANPVKSLNNALVLVKHQLSSSHHDNNNDAHDDMANMATARRFIDDYMRGIESRKKKETDKNEDCAGNFKCEITRKYKRGGEDCNCELVCMAKVSETMLIHEEAKK
jgi:hypothetical protein